MLEIFLRPVSPGFFLFNQLFFSLSLSTFYYMQQEETRKHLQQSAWKFSLAILTSSLCNLLPSAADSVAKLSAYIYMTLFPSFSTDIFLTF